MALHTKKFKGKTIKFHSVLEGKKIGDSWAGKAYCPWCSTVKEVSDFSSEKRAAQHAFSIIEAHWKVVHKNEK